MSSYVLVDAMTGTILDIDHLYLLDLDKLTQEESDQLETGPDSSIERIAIEKGQKLLIVPML